MYRKNDQLLQSRPAGKTRKRPLSVSSLAKLRKKISKELKMSSILPYTPATVPKNHCTEDNKTPSVEKHQSAQLASSEMKKKKDDLDKAYIKKVKRVLRKMKKDRKAKTEIKFEPSYKKERRFMLDDYVKGKLDIKRRILNPFLLHIKLKMLR